MVILTVSDEVVPIVYSLSIKERFSGVQLVLSCGDLPYFYLEYIVTMLGVACYYVRGNHDVRAEYSSDGAVVTEPRGCVSLEGRSTFHHGLLIAGLGGSMYYNGETPDQYTERQMAVRAWRMVPGLILNQRRHGRYLDVLLTHAPPLGIHNGPDRPHRGFKVFLAIMQRFKPRYLIHGHIHTSYGFSKVTETRYHQTLVLNTAGYRLLDIAVPPPGREPAWPVPQEPA